MITPLKKNPYKSYWQSQQACLKGSIFTSLLKHKRSEAKQTSLEKEQVGAYAWSEDVLFARESLFVYKLCPRSVSLTAE